MTYAHRGCAAVSFAIYGENYQNFPECSSSFFGSNMEGGVLFFFVVFFAEVLTIWGKVLIVFVFISSPWSEGLFSFFVDFCVYS